MERLCSIPSRDLFRENDEKTKLHEKILVIDTNIFLDYPDILEKLSWHPHVVVPYAVLNELDVKKGVSGALGKNARDAIKSIKKMVLQSSVLLQGDLCGRGDDDILGCCKTADHALLTNDQALAIKVIAKGFSVVHIEIPRQDFSIGKIRRLDIEDSVLIDGLYENKDIGVNALGVTPDKFIENENVVLQAGKRTALAVFRKGHLRVLADQSKLFSIKPRNAEQKFLAAALMDKSVDLVICAGVAGSGKTLLSLAAGLFQKEGGHYDKILLVKAIEDVGNNIGFLKGDKNEKLESWCRPYYDNLDYLMRGQRPGKLEEMFEAQEIELEALTFMRGRSLLHSYCIFDELQNVEPRHLKMLVSRVGDGSKLVLLGDLEQIDNPHLSHDYNGLRHVMERMWGLENVAIFNLETSIRKKLTSQAIERL